MLMRPQVHALRTVSAWERALERGYALAVVVLVPIALRVLPLRATLALCDRFPRLASAGASPLALTSRVHRWLSHGRGLWTSSCLTRAVVLYTMLRQHGHRPRLHIGVQGASTSFVAHSWVSLAGRPLGEDSGVSREYRELLEHHG
jgi:hypothetical protein